MASTYRRTTRSGQQQHLGKRRRAEETRPSRRGATVVVASQGGQQQQCRTHTPSSGADEFQRPKTRPPQAKRQQQLLLEDDEFLNPNSPIGAPGGGARARPRPAAGAAVRNVGGGASRQNSLTRPRSTRSMGTVDPYHLVGRRIWRHYPNENADLPWVEGFIFEYDGENGTYRILYDPNDPDRPESIEEGFDYEKVPANEYVLGDFFDLEQSYGSRRVARRPNPVSIPPPQTVAMPNKRRRSASMKIMQTIPFPPAWFETALLEASGDDLHTMLHMLETKEVQVVAALEEAEMALLMGPDLDKRAELEKKFEELCKREEQLMAEYSSIKNSEP